MEQGGGGLPLVHYLLQNTLRSFCSNSQWVYSIFWRILPRNYPPPKWDTDASMLDRSKANKRNWIIVWEDGYCDFDTCMREAMMISSVDEEEEDDDGVASSTINNTSLNPELFFKMSHDIYNYGEGLMGKIASDNSHKWIYRDPPTNEMSSVLSPWHTSIDPHPRTWEAQFKAGIQTIAVISVGEGLLQLGSTKKIIEDPNMVLQVQRILKQLQSVPGMVSSHPMQQSSFMRRSDPFQQKPNINIDFKRSPTTLGLIDVPPMVFPHLPPSSPDATDNQWQPLVATGQSSSNYISNNFALPSVNVNHRPYDVNGLPAIKYMQGQVDVGLGTNFLPPHPQQELPICPNNMSFKCSSWCESTPHNR